MTDGRHLTVARLDAMAPARAGELLVGCCASRRWVQAIVGTRPHRTLAGLTLASDRAAGTLGWADLLEALAAHPRIGERPAGTGREATWSRQEQAASAPADAAVQAELRSANVAYEDRFGHVFLVCATGRSAAQVLAELRSRLGNDPSTEREVVRRELQAIARLRLAKLFGAGPPAQGGS